MNRIGYLTPALFMLAAGAVSAQDAGSRDGWLAVHDRRVAVAAGSTDDPDNDPAAAAGIKVPNVPAELSDPPLAAPPVAQPPVPPPVQPAAPPVAPPTAATSSDTSTRPATPLPPPVHVVKPVQRIMPARDAASRVVFMFGDSSPTLVCAPLHVCDVELQAGEVVQGVPHIGDPVGWKVSPAVSGTADQKTIHLIIKPLESGLDTNLIVPTDRHTYHLHLVSSWEHYVSNVGFFYPQELQQDGRGIAKAVPPGGDMPTVMANRLNFNYRIKVVKGKPSFKPLRAMDDGYHTYISMNKDLQQGEAPMLVGISAGGDEQMVNYHVKGNLYVVDGTLFKMALVSGVGGKQERVELTRDPCQRHGWLGICWDAKE